MTEPASAHYTGDFEHKLDDKNRITIPSAWRWMHAESDTFLALPQDEDLPDGGHIVVLPPAAVAQLRAKVALIPLGDREGQKFLSRRFAKSLSFSFDKQGRVPLTKKLLALAGITETDVTAGVTGSAVLVGSLNTFKIYSPGRWRALVAEDAVSVAATTVGDAEQMRRLGL